MNKFTKIVGMKKNYTYRFYDLNDNNHKSVK